MNKRMWIGLPCVSPGRYMVDAVLYDALLAAAEEVLRTYMPQFNDSRAVDDCLVGLALAVSEASP